MPRRTIAQFGVAVLAVALSATGARAGEELGRGHITGGGPWTGVCSITVVLDRDSIDGFFLPLEPRHWGHRLETRVFGNGPGLPYSLSVNFHGSGRGFCGRQWLGGCPGDSSGDVPECRIPDEAKTVEVTARKGADLQANVRLID